MIDFHTNNGKHKTLPRNIYEHSMLPRLISSQSEERSVASNLKVSSIWADQYSTKTFVPLQHHFITNITTLLNQTNVTTNVIVQGFPWLLNITHLHAFSLLLLLLLSSINKRISLYSLYMGNSEWQFCRLSNCWWIS